MAKSREDVIVEWDISQMKYEQNLVNIIARLLPIYNLYVTGGILSWPDRVLSTLVVALSLLGLLAFALKGV